MKARQLVFTEKTRVVVEEQPLPDHPGPGEVLVENVYSLISPGTELAMFTKTHIGFPDPDFRYAKYPFRPGYAAVGRVLEVGSGVKGVSEGTMLYTRGRHASHAILKVDETVSVPDGMPLEHVPFAALAHIALTSVRLSNVRLGRSVAVFGQGLVGNFAGQLMRAAGGMPVIGIDAIAERLQKASRCGIDFVINAAEEDAVDRVKALTGGPGANIVVEATGNPEVARPALKAAARMGQVVLLGSPRGTAEVDLYFDLHRTGVSLIGAHAGRQADAREYSDPDPQVLVLNLIAAERIKVAPVLTHKLPVRDADLAYRGLLDKKNEYLGVIFDLSDW